MTDMHLITLTLLLLVGCSSSSSGGKDGRPTDAGGDVPVDTSASDVWGDQDRDSEVDLGPQLGDDCLADTDCPPGGFCWDSSSRGTYCAECVVDSQCARGWGCEAATRCVELLPCDSGPDCATHPDSVVHDACIDRTCVSCVDDADCEDGEICYSRDCVVRDAVEASCLDASCKGACDVSHDDEGVITGIECVDG